MDIIMPNLDGISATHFIRAASNQIPIIAMTANTLEANRDTCFAAGMDDFATKPFTLTKLRTFVQKWLNSSITP